MRHDISRYLLETHIKTNARFSNGITYDARIVLYINHQKQSISWNRKSYRGRWLYVTQVKFIGILSHMFVKNYLEYFQMYPRHVMIH